MSNDVFANGREISCKEADGKSICAFPDVCFTPPQTPATPPGVPIPYPNTAFAKDTTKGSKTVKISGKEVMLKNKSYFKKSTGDEAGNAPKKGVVTSKITGKVYFTSWSPDVKFEGKNVVRHLDLTTHNHASPPGQTPPQSYIDSSTSPEEPQNCNHEWECVPKATHHGENVEEVAKDKEEKCKKVGDPFEAQAIRHNKKDIKSGKDIGPDFKCKKCPATKEVDHVTRDDQGNITKIVQCKSDQSKATGGDSEKGVIIKPDQLREDRKLIESINECQKNSGVKTQLEYKLQKGESAKDAERFLKKKKPPIVTIIEFIKNIID
ncbi:hypothetical protein THII_0995 [Thioploca ingrica]|uniref:Uncharacterized protein n=1 Tax=Thioploca ingrica TaxID=40754 RepID=A0A090AIQ5_9GAMM|nr:hypothetical protein THII_0995 [Thioploca ingrica]